MLLKFNTNFHKIRVDDCRKTDNIIQSIEIFVCIYLKVLISNDHIFKDEYLSMSYLFHRYKKYGDRDFPLPRRWELSRVALNSQGIILL